MSSIRTLPLKQHALHVKAQVARTRKDYGLRDVPKIVHKLVMNWGEEYIQGNRIREFDALMKAVSSVDDRFLENLIVLEQVPPEHLEECVTKTRNMLMGVE